MPVTRFVDVEFDPEGPIDRDDLRRLQENFQFLLDKAPEIKYRGTDVSDARDNLAGVLVPVIAAGSVKVSGDGDYKAKSTIDYGFAKFHPSCTPHILVTATNTNQRRIFCRLLNDYNHQKATVQSYYYESKRPKKDQEHLKTHNVHWIAFGWKGV